VWGFDDLTLAADASVDSGHLPDGGPPPMDAGPDTSMPPGDDAGDDDAGEAGVIACDGGSGHVNDGITNCGGCGQVCDNTNSLGATCAPSDAGVWGCHYTKCAAGLIDCNSAAPDLDGCDTSMTSTSACGACGIACDTTNSVGASCVMGGNGVVSCQYTSCEDGFADCDTTAPNTDGCETSLKTPDNCGACGKKCDTTNSNGPSCTDGNTCQYASCKNGYVDCKSDAPDTDGCETMAASNSCTACGMPCDSSHSTSNGCDTSGSSAFCKYSACAAGWKDCNTTPPDTNGCDTQINTPNNCGDCGISCDTTNSNGAQCTSGACTYSGCKPGFLDCNGTVVPNADGCESSSKSVASCGACGVKCKTTTGTASCNGSTCSYACSSGTSDCNAGTAPNADGCECPTPGCCGAGKCQTVHTNGLGGSYYDCGTTKTYNQTTATEACEAAAGAGNCKATMVCCGLLGTCLLADATQSACGIVGSSCYCWQWVGGYPGTLQAEPLSACTATCGAKSDKTWN
jgi:hypothetical protein